ncbi:hypothetical protein [Buttiauxella noackiae]|uniref:hypothetical protein n=1 Tax=Buttiauxella noackiae TaxID=82992 RepID=UPI001428C91E|nr:hypothetical protein [Buttiauxella noackiae]
MVEVAITTGGSVLSRAALAHSVAMLERTSVFFPVVALADKELSQSLSALDGIVRAVKLKRMALSAEQARTTHNGRFSEYEVDIDKSVYAEIRAYLEPRVTKYAFDMASEPELSVFGLSPALSKYMDEALASPAKRHVAFNEIKLKESQLKEKGGL